MKTFKCIFSQRYSRTISYALILVLLSFIYSIKNHSLLQAVHIKFKLIPGAQYYEIQFLTNKKEGKEQDQKIVKLTNDSFIEKIDRKYHSFQIRAFFSEQVKTSWSLIRHIDLRDEKIDHSKLILTNDVRYRTSIQINYPYYYRNNILWVGPKTKLGFRATNPTFINKKEIFYQFRQKNASADSSFIAFTSIITLQSIFQDIEDSYIISFYSINNKKLKEPLREVTIYVDTNPPKITFTKTTQALLWDFVDKSLPVNAVLKQGDKVLKSKMGITTLKLDLTNQTQEKKGSLSLLATDFLGNQEVWREVEPRLNK